MKKNNYFIKDGYKCNLTGENSNVKTYTEPPKDNTYQISVYKYIGKIARKIKATNVLELGFGTGHKIVKYVKPYCKNVYGLDFPHSVEYAKKNLPQGKWHEGDFNVAIPIPDVSFDIIFSLDVIEHLVYPEKFLRSIHERASIDTIVILSTPERDLVRGFDSYGPSENLKHVREWNKNEFRAFIESEGFKILEHKFMRDREKHIREKIHNWRKGINDKTCQVVVCKKTEQYIN